MLRDLRGRFFRQGQGCRHDTWQQTRLSRVENAIASAASFTSTSMLRDLRGRVFRQGQDSVA
jgi:hypothetical protein